MNTQEITKLHALLSAQNKAVQIIKSIKSTSDLNFSHSGIRTFKISDNVITQIQQVLLELDQINS